MGSDSRTLADWASAKLLSLRHGADDGPGQEGAYDQRGAEEDQDDAASESQIIVAREDDNADKNAYRHEFRERSAEPVRF